MTEGRVLLVGAGPGAVDLLTLRAHRAIAMADVVLHDRLVPHTIVALAPEHALVIDVGKRPGGYDTQDWIHALLVEHASAGRIVVRLKGGDPMVFGRGGEELAHCAAHGIPVEVVPGVTSAIGGPTGVGLPVTHREIGRAHV